MNAKDPQLMQLGARAEHYLHDDPVTAIFKLRQFAERASKTVAARHAVYLGEHETFEERLRRLSLERIIPKQIADLFHGLRKMGNKAVHDERGSHADALTALKFAWQLGVWFHRTYHKDLDFKPAPFVPPSKPTAEASAASSDTALAAIETALKEQLDELNRRLAETESNASRAKREAEDQASARENLEEALKREAEEKKIWEQLAHEAEKSASEARRPPLRQALQERLSIPGSGLAEYAEASIPFDLAQSSDVAHLQALQEAAEQSSKSELAELSHIGEQAASKIDLDEAATRELIDQQLRDSGWEADTKELRYAKGARPIKNRNLAIAEWPTSSGPADYALFAGLTLIGVVEGKRRRKNVSAAIDQAERYSKGVDGSEDFSFAGGPWADHKVPFVFAANGRSYLKQVETESGIWFRDTRRTANHRRALVGWPTAAGLVDLLNIDYDAAAAALSEMPFEFGFPLRDYQRSAIKAVESALAVDRRSMLLAMATGTGKTKLAIAMLYRLLATKRFRRVCFVVDRSALGEQAAGEFSTTKIVSGKAFADIFGLKKLADITPDSDTKIHICTIQGLVKRVLYTSDDAEAPPVDQYDLMVVDECHRGYLLDREMSDDELSFRGQDDYISKYRRVLEYFDAVKIGLTATPALHTTQIFGDPIFTYSYRQAVIDSYLIDHEPPVRIETALTRAGIVFEKDEKLELLNTRTGEIDLAHAPDEIRFDVEQFNKQVVTVEFNRVVAEELTNHIDPDLPGKTLIFAATDAHADIVVSAIKKAFSDKCGEIDDASVRKITGSVDRVGTLIRSYRNE